MGWCGAAVVSVPLPAATGTPDAGTPLCPDMPGLLLGVRMQTSCCGRKSGDGAGIQFETLAGCL